MTTQRETGSRVEEQVMRYVYYAVITVAMLVAAGNAAMAAPAGCKGAQFRSFDFAVGTWIAHNKKGEVNGKAEVARVLDGCSIRMHWTGRTYEGANNNTYDETRALWQKAWFDNTGGVELSTGHIVNGALVYTGYDYDNGKIAGMHRETWSLLPDGRMRELYELSSDNGRSWKWAFTTTYTRVKRDAYAALKIVQDR